MKRNAIHLLVLMLLACPTTAQEGAGTDALRRAAERAWRARDYAAAVEPLAALTAAAPADAQAWYRLGYSLHSLGRLDDALPAHLQAAQRATGEQARIRATATYNVACVHALRGEKAQALDWLEKAVAAGFRDTDYMQYDSDLASLREEERFLALVKRVESARKRVAVVRLDAVVELERLPGGDFRLRLRSGAEVTLSRTRRAAFERALGRPI